MEIKTNSKTVQNIFFSKPPVTKGRTIFKTVTCFITTIYLAFVIGDNFTKSLFQKEFAVVYFLIVLNFLLLFNAWRKYFKQHQK